MPAKIDWALFDHRRQVGIAAVCGALILVFIVLVMQELPVSTR